MSTKKVPIRCSLSSEIRWFPLFCYAKSVTGSNMHLNYKHFSMPYIQKNEMSDKSAFLHDRLTFSALVHLDGFYNLYSCFYNKPINKKTFFLNLSNSFFYLKIIKKNDIAVRQAYQFSHFLQRKSVEIKKLSPGVRFVQITNRTDHQNHPDMTSL